MGPDPGAFAALLCGYCLDVRPGQQVVGRSTTLAAPLIAALQRELLEREAWPLLRTELPGAIVGLFEDPEGHTLGLVEARAAAQ